MNTSTAQQAESVLAQLMRQREPGMFTAIAVVADICPPVTRRQMLAGYRILFVSFLGIWLLGMVLLWVLDELLPAFLAGGGLILLGIGLMIFLYWTERRLQFCPQCEVLCGHPMWGGQPTRCPGCERLLRPEQLVGAAPGILDLCDAAKIARTDPVVTLVAMVVLVAIKDRVAEVCFEPMEKSLRLTYSIDGRVYDLVPPPRHLADTLREYVKALAGLNPQVKGIRQEGTVVAQLPESSTQMRVVVEPSAHGEKITVRFV